MGPVTGAFFFIVCLVDMKLGFFARDKTFAKELVARLIKQLPPESLESRRKVLSVNKITRLLEATYQAAGVYQREQRPGFVRRAVLANAFRWGLNDAGYAQDFVDVAVEGLVIEMSRSPRQPPPGPVKT